MGHPRGRLHVRHGVDVAEQYHLDKLHDEAQASLDALAAKLWPDLVVIDDHVAQAQRPDTPFLDELERADRLWFR